ncbi:MAG: ComEC family competence protein [Bacteroidetes bacterium]|nr:ComEC family competence protein [Bacteroidota bacterium]
MSFLHQIPFFRVLTPFMLGISLNLALQNTGSNTYLLVLIYLLCLLIYVVSKGKTNTKINTLMGVFVQLFLFASGYTLCAYNNDKQKPNHYTHYINDSSSLFYGYVQQIPVEKNKSIKTEIELKQIKINNKWQPASGTVIAYFEKKPNVQMPETGENLVFTGHLQEVQVPLNPHEFDYKNYLRYRNIFHTIYIKDSSWSSIASNQEAWFFSFAQKIRKKLLDVYRGSGLSNKEFALLAALVLGYDDEIDAPTMNAYSHTGTLHVLSVSGLHVGLIYLLLGYLLTFLNQRKTVWLRVFLIISVLWFFVLLSGFSAPAVRAAFMFSFILIGKTLFQQTETANIVLATAFFSLCINPYWLIDVGFQLSYAAVLGIIYLYPFFNNMILFPYVWANKLWALCAVSIAAQVATLPLTLYYFHQFPLLFLVTNLVVIPLSTIIMYGGILLLLFFKIKVISGFLVSATALLIKIMNASALYFDSLPFCMVDGINVSLFTMVGLYVLLVGIFLCIEQRSFVLLMTCTLGSILLVSISIFDDIKTKFQHQCIVYHSNEQAVLSVFSGTNMVLLTDTCNDKRLQSTLRENKIKNNGVKEHLKTMPAMSLIGIGSKKILFAKNTSLLNETLIQALCPDYIWIPAYALKNKKTPAFLIGKNNIILSGKIPDRKSINTFYLTQKKGAFVTEDF